MQHPPGGKRTPAEEEAFQRALKVMADIYASAVGTTVLQLKSIPIRPERFDGKLCLFGLRDDEATVRHVLDRFGAIVKCELTQDPAVVHFATHGAARAVRREAEQAIASCMTSEDARKAISRALGLQCDGIDTMYNERSYDGRKADGDQDGDDGRGW